MPENKMPVAFVTDFGPFPAFETDDYTKALGQLGSALPRPKAIVIMSGHWMTRGPLAVTGAKKPGILHDYSGFPDEFYRIDYPAPGTPALAQKIAGLLSAAGFPTNVDATRAFDHGAWVPLSRFYPKADVPTIQLTVPAGQDPKKIMEIGRALEPLRADGVLLVGAGALSHNLRLALVHGKDDSADAWAVTFDAWLEQKLNQGDTAALVNYRAAAPGAALAAPTPEHFDPLFFVLGAASGEKPTHAYRGIRFGNGIMRIFTYGAPTLSRPALV